MFKNICTLIVWTSNLVSMVWLLRILGLSGNTGGVVSAMPCMAFTLLPAPLYFLLCDVRHKTFYFAMQLLIAKRLHIVKSFNLTHK